MNQAQALSPPNSNSDSDNEALEQASSSSEDSSDPNTPPEPLDADEMPSPVFNAGERIEFITPKIPMAEVPSTSVQQDLLRELKLRDIMHKNAKMLTEFNVYEEMRKKAKKAFVKHSHRMSALCDIMDEIDLTQAAFDLISPKFVNPGPVPAKLTYEQFVRMQIERDEKCKNSILNNTGQPTLVKAAPQINTSNAQVAATPVVQMDTDEVMILTLRINNLATFFPNE
jgi:hypothetical protein